MLVLIADDALFMRMCLSRIVRENGYDVICATDGIEALSMFDKYKPQAAIIDYHMPGLHGLDVIKSIRAVDRDVKIVMCSSVTDTRVIADVISAGANDYLRKPFTIEDGTMLVKRL